MNNLKKYKLDELYEMGSGISSTKEQAGHGYPFASFSTVFNNIFLPNELKDLMETSEEQRETSSIRAGDVLITRTSETSDELAMSCVALKDYPNATFSGFVKRLRPITKGVANPKYMAFYLRSSYFRKLINANTIMTLRASFNEDIFSFLDVYLPEYKTQEKIGQFLYLIEEKIKNNNKINNNLIETIDTIYNEFVFSDRAKKSDFKVQNMFKNDLYSLIKPGVSQFDTKTYYATSEVNGMYISDGWTISYDNRESRANMTPTLYSVWFAKMKNSIKHLFLNDEMSNFVDNSILSTGFYGLQCNELTFEYVASVIHNANFEKLKDILSHGATQQGIGDDDLKNIKLLVPSQELLKEYHNKTAPMFSLISKNINENNALIQLRNELLPLLMNGQATVGD